MTSNLETSITGTASDAGNAAGIFRDFGDIDFLAAAVALTVTVLSIAAVKLLIPKVASLFPDRFRFWFLPWAPVLRLLFLLAAALFITPLFVEPTAENLFAIGGAMAVALGFAFKDYVSSLIAGVVVLFERPYREGDWVQLGEIYGEVERLGLRAVEIRTPDDTLVAIPHLEMWTAPVQNANSGKPELQCVANFYLHPDHDGEAVRQALEDVAMSSSYLHLDRPVTVVAEEEPWGTHYRLKAYPIEGRTQFSFLTDLTLRGKVALRRLGARPSGLPAIDGRA